MQNGINCDAKQLVSEYVDVKTHLCKTDGNTSLSLGYMSFKDTDNVKVHELAHQIGNGI